MKYLHIITIVILFQPACVRQQPNPETPYSDTSLDFLRDFAPLTDDGFVNVVIEIPAGSNEKWEVEKNTGHLEWERRGDSLRVVRYQPYPANYGMIPRTWLPPEQGGDNDPLDVFLMGVSAPRGSVVPARIIGVILMLDKNETDNKLIAIPVDGWYSNIRTLSDYQDMFPGTIEILKIWLDHYKGPGFVEIQGVGDELAATEILLNAIETYRNKEELVISE